jgi:hypothetical protein
MLALAAGLGWFLADGIGYHFLMTENGFSSPVQLFAWGAANAFASLLAIIAATASRPQPLLWALAVLAGGLSGLPFYRAEETAESLLPVYVLGAISLAVVTAMFGLILARRP